MELKCKLILVQKLWNLCIAVFMMCISMLFLKCPPMPGFPNFCTKINLFLIPFARNPLKHPLASYWCLMGLWVNTIINTGRLPQCHYVYPKTKTPLSHYPSDPNPACLTSPQVRLSSAPCTLATKKMMPGAHLPSWEAVAGNCLCNPMTTFLYLAEIVVARICPAQFFLQFQCSKSQTISWKAHWPWQYLSERKFPPISQSYLWEGSFLIQINCMDQRRAENLHGDPSPSSTLCSP